MLPNDIFKVECLYDANQIPLKNDYINQGQYIFLPDSYTSNEIYADYYSLAVDANGYPYIKRGYELAAYSYCVYKMFEEDASAIPPRIQQREYRDWETDRKSTRLNSSHSAKSRMPSSA